MNEKKDSLFRHLTQVIALIALTGLTVILFEPTRQHINEQMSELRDLTIERIEQEIGRHIEYDSVSPSIITRFEIRGLRVLEPLGSGGLEGDPLLQLESILVRYRVIPLLLGQPERALREIRLRNTEITIDLDRDEEFIEWISSLVGGSGPAEAIPDESSGDTASPLLSDGVLLSTRNLSVTVRDNGGSVTAERLHASARQTGGEIVLSVRSTLHGSHSILSELGSFESDISADITFGPGLSYANGFLDILRLSSDVLVLSRQQFRLQSGSDSFEIRKVQDSAPVDILVRGGSEGLELSLALEEYQLSELIRFRGELEAIDPWLASGLTGSATFRAHNDGRTEYEAQFATDIPEARLGTAVHLETRLRGTSERINIPVLRLTTPFGRAIYAGSFDLATYRPTGSLYLDDVQLGDAPSLSALVHLEPRGDALVARAPSVHYAGVHVREVAAIIGWSENRVNADVSGLIGEEGVFHALGDIELDDDGDFETRLSLSDIPARHSTRLITAAAGGSGGSTEAQLVPDSWFLSGSLGLSGTRDSVRLDSSSLSVRDRQNSEDRLDITVDEREGGYEALLELARGAVKVNTTLAVRLLPSGTLLADGDVDVNEQRYNLDFVIAPGRSVTVSEEGGSRVELSFLGDDELQGRIELNALSLPRVLLAALEAQSQGAALEAQSPGAHELSSEDRPGPTISMITEAHFSAADSWRVDIQRAHLADLRLIDRSIDLRLSGRFDESGGIVESLEFSDNYGTIDGAGTVTYGFSDALTGTVNLVAEGSGSDERYELDLRYETLDINGRLRVRSSPLDRLEMDSLAGVFNADLTVEGPLTDPVFSAGVSVSTATFDDEPINGEVTIEFADRRISFGGLTINYLASTLTDGSGAVDFQSGAFNFSALFEGIQADEPFTTDVQLDGVLAVENGIIGADLVRVPVEAELVLDGLPIEIDLPDRWELALSRDNEGIVSVSGGPENSIAAQIDATGSFTLSLSDPLPFLVEAEGVLSAADIEANLTRVSFDVARVPNLFDFGEFRLVEGQASGSLRMTGPIFDPDFFGTMTATNVVGELSFFSDRIGPTDGFLVFSEREMRVHPLRTVVGQSEADFSAVFLLSRWNLEQFELDISTIGATGPRIDWDFGAIEVDGYARGDLTITQSGSDVRIAGNLVAHNTTITLSEIDESDTEPPGPDDDGLVADLTIEAGRSVEFLWPTTAFPVLRAVARQGDRVRITADTLSETFSLTGDIGMQGGELFYFDRSFLIRDGVIRFNETQDDFDPRLTVRAETRDIGPDGPIRISLVADESLLSELTVRVVSDPPLPEEDVLALLGAGVFSSAEGGLINLSSAVLLGSDLVSQFGVIRSVESSIRNALNLDLFTVRTQLFQNLVREVIEDPNQDSEAPIPSLGRYFDNTTVFLGRALGPDVFLEFLVQLRADDPFVDAERQFAALNIDTELSLEFETPFFNIQWSFMPRNPDKLFVPDNRLTLSWGFSY